MTEVKYWTPSKKEDAVTIASIAQDESGKITAFETFSTKGEPMAKYDAIEKDASGKIIKISGKNIFNNTSLKIEFTYTGDNIVKSTFTDGPDVRYTLYTYDSSNRVVTKADYNTYNKLANKKTLTYTGSDVNPSTEKNELTSVNPAKVSTVTFKYDDKNNPYLKADPILYYMGAGDLNTHNVIERKDDSFTLTIKYVYNPSGYPVSEAFSTDAGHKFTYK